MTSRLSGDCLELLVGWTLKLNKIQCLSNEKYLTLLEKYEDTRIEQLLPRYFRKVNKLLHDIIQRNEITSFSYMSDNAGKVGISSDILLHTRDNEHIGLSLKRNSQSLKAHRPSNLVGANLIRLEQHRVQYKFLNDYWFEKFKLNGYSFYKEIPKQMKKQMLTDMATLYEEALYSIDTHLFLKFILGDAHYMIKWSSKRNCQQFVLIDLSSIKTFHKTMQHSINRRTYNPQIRLFVKKNELDGNDPQTTVEISMRLHTCKSNIRSNLDLKFDVTIPKLLQLSGCIYS